MKYCLTYEILLSNELTILSYQIKLVIHFVMDFPKLTQLLNKQSILHPRLNDSNFIIFIYEKLILNTMQCDNGCNLKII